jgi:hypothetical protein
LKFFAFLLATGVEQCLDERDKVRVRERLLEKVDRADAGRALALRGEVDGGQNDGACVRMAGAEVVKELLSEIVSRIDIEDEQIGLLIYDDVLRLFQAVRDIDVCSRRGLKKRSANRGGEVAIGCQDKDAAGGLGSGD